MGRALVGGAQVNVTCWAAEVRERRVVEARAHGQQRPEEEESETRHRNNKSMILSVY